MKQLIRLISICLLLLVVSAPYGQAAQVLDGVPVTDKVIALTIEDIEKHADMKQILEITERWKAKVTFFISAELVEPNRTAIKLAVEQGHEFGNHGLHHRYWGDAAAADIQKELTEAEGILRGATGRGTVLFKPPYNYYESKYLDAVKAASVQGIIVRGADLADWILMTTEAVVERAKASAANGAILQVNYKMKQAADALPAILEELSKAGYRIVTVSELKAKAAVPPSKPPTAQRPPVKPGFFGVVNRLSTSQSAVALTFDDGGSVYKVNTILDILKEHQAKATFFLLGEWVNENPDLVRRMASEGHEVANHSYSHPRFTWLNEEEVRREIEITQTAIAEAVGRASAALFRPPYGSYNSAVVNIVKEMGYGAVVMWNIDTRDWSGISAEAISDHVLERVSPGAVVLFHLHAAHTPEALAELIPALKSRGYRLSTIGEVLDS